MVHKSQLKYLILLLFISFISACKKKSDTGLSQGKIVFDVTYMQDRVGSMSTSMMPRQMTMEYKGNYSKNTIEGGLGFFNLVNISDLRNFRNTTYLKFLDKKYIYEGEKKDTPCCIGDLYGMQVQFTEKTREIAGFICKHAIANFPDDNIDSFDIWYTEEIPLKHPNGNTPFGDIPGVLMEFNNLLGEMVMHMKAKSFEAIAIEDEEFQSPENYRPVTKVEMENILDALLK
jgi:GLPGLI family protein